MQKIRTLFFSTIPCLLGIGLQLISSFYLMLLSALFVFFVLPQNSTDKKLDYLMQLWLNTDFNALIMIIFSLSCCILFGIWYSKIGRIQKPEPKQIFHPLQIVGIICLVPGTQFMSSLLVNILSLFFPSWLENYETLIENAGLTGTISIFMLLYSIFLAPISEELIFRGVTMQIARKAFPFWLANTIQALLFGVFHMNMLQGCYAFALGLFLGYVCAYGGTIYHSILFHFLFNLWGTTASEWLTIVSPMLASFLILFGTIGGLGAGLFFFRKGTKEQKKDL